MSAGRDTAACRLLDPVRLHRTRGAARLRGPVWVLDQTPSTMDDALALALSGAAEGTMVVAAEQTRGRGRQQSRWVAAHGQGLLATLVLRPVVPPARWPLLANVAGIAVAHMLRHRYGLPAVTKWPNDILVNRRKIAGVLLEARVPDFALLGLGLNLRGEGPALDGNVLPPTTLQRETGIAEAVEAVLDGLLTALEPLYLEFLDGRSAALVARQRPLESTLGQAVIAEREGLRVAGIARDLDDTGALLIAASEGMVRWDAGAVKCVRWEDHGRETP